MDQGWRCFFNCTPLVLATLRMKLSVRTNGFRFDRVITSSVLLSYVELVTLPRSVLIFSTFSTLIFYVSHSQLSSIFNFWSILIGM